MNKKVKVLSIVLGSIFLILILLDVTVRVLVTKEKFEAFVLPAVENAIQKKLSIGDFSASLAGGIILEKTTLFEDLNGTNPLIAFDKVSVGVSFLGALTGDYRVESLEIENPALYVVRTKEGRFNFEPPSTQEEKAEKKESGGLPALSAALDEFRLKNGKVIFSNNDSEFPIKSFTLDAINLSIDSAEADLENEVVTFERVMLSLLNAGEVELSGRVQGLNEKANVDITLITRDFHPAIVVRKLAPELPKEFEDVKANVTYRLKKEGMVVNVSGDVKVDNSVNLHYSVKPDITLDLETMVANATVTDISLQNAPAGKEPNFLFLKELRVKDVKLKDKITISKVVLKSPQLVVERSKDGKLNVMEIIKGLLPERDKKTSAKAGKEAAKKDEQPPLEIDLVKIKDASISYIDSSIKSPDFRFHMKDMYLTLRDVGKKGLPKIEFGGGMEDSEKKTAGSFKGAGMLNPFTKETKDLKFSLDDVSLKSFSPIAEKAKDVTINDGLASVVSTTNIDKEGNLLTMANIEVKDLAYDAPPMLASSSKLVLATLKDTGGVLRLDDIKIKGNVNSADFDYLSTINSALANSLTNPKTLAVGAAAVLGGAALLPPLAILGAGSKVLDMIGGDKKKATTKKSTTTKEKKKEGGMLEGIGGLFGN